MMWTTGAASVLWFSVEKMGLPGGASGEEPTCQCKRLKRRGFGPWLGKNPWRRKWQPNILAWEIPWTEEPGGLWSVRSQ